MKYITSDPQTDRDFYRRNKDKKNAKLPLVSGREQERLFLRNIFIEDDSDIQIAQIVSNYFYAVQNKWSDAWNNVTPTLILNKSTGFIALMKFLKDAYLHIGKVDSVPTKDDFVRIFENIGISSHDFNREGVEEEGLVCYQ